MSALAATLVFRGVYRAYFGSPLITIINRSAHPVHDIVLRGNSFVKAVGPIPAGSRQAIILHLSGESGLMIEFVANGQRITKDDLAYIEGSGGYCVTLLIDDQLKIRPIDSGFCFAIRRAV
jgi:hypothetical protein